MIVRDADGVQVLELGDDGYTGGYLARSLTDGARNFRRITVDAPLVDGEVDVAVALRRVRLTLVVGIEGTLGEVRTRRAALLAAVEQPVWFLDVGDGIQWQCGYADSDTARFEDAPGTTDRVVTLTIPAMPSTYGY